MTTLVNPCPLRHPGKMEHFFFYSTSDGAVIVRRPGSGRQAGGEPVMFMSMIRSRPAPLAHGAAQHQTAAAIYWIPSSTV